MYWHAPPTFCLYLRDMCVFEHLLIHMQTHCPSTDLLRGETSWEQRRGVTITICTIHSTCTHYTPDTITSNQTQCSHTHINKIQRVSGSKAAYKTTIKSSSHTCRLTTHLKHTCTQYMNIHNTITHVHSFLHNPQQIGLMLQGRYRCTISCLALWKHGVMAGRNCVGNKCITSVWEGCLIINHQPVCVCVSVWRGGEERDGISKRG